MIEHISKMLAAFPGEKSDETLALFLERAKAHTPDVVAETCDRFVSAKINRNHSFAPSVPEFAEEAQKVADWHASRAKKTEPLRLVPHTPLEDRLASFRAEFAGRDLIEESVNSKRFMEGCRRKIWPVGATYCAALGSVFAPRRTLGREAAE